MVLRVNRRKGAHLLPTPLYRPDESDRSDDLVPTHPAGRQAAECRGVHARPGKRHSGIQQGIMLLIAMDYSDLRAKENEAGDCRESADAGTRPCGAVFDCQSN